MATLPALARDLEAVEDAQRLLDPPPRPVEVRLEDAAADRVAPADQRAVAEALVRDGIEGAQPEPRGPRREPPLLRLAEAGVLEDEQQAAVAPARAQRGRGR